MIEMEFPVDIAPFFPRWVALLIMPVGFATISLHMIHNSYSKLKNRIVLFNANQKHLGTNSTNCNNRMVINFNYF